MESARYSINEILESAIKYRTKSQWESDCPELYRYAEQQGMMSLVFPRRIGSAKNYFSFAECKVHAFLCENRTQWRVKFRKSLDCALTNGWVDQLMPISRPATPVAIYTTAQIRLAASRCKTLYHWSVVSNKTYTYARINGWIKSVVIPSGCFDTQVADKEDVEFLCQDPVVREPLKSPDSSFLVESLLKGAASSRNRKARSTLGLGEEGKVNYSYVKCLSELKAFGDMDAWEKSSSDVYRYAEERDWLGRLRQSLENSLKPKANEPTKDECSVAAKSFPSKRQWQMKDPRTYLVAKRRGWLKEMKCGG